MHPSRILSLALATLNLPFSLAFVEIDTSPTITAATDTTIKIVNDLSSGPGSFDSQFDSYRLYLSLAPPGWGSAPACYLVNSSAINITSQTVQIPASVGPSDRSSQNYAIAAVEFNQDPSAGGPSPFEVGDLFDFVGGTGNWSQYELNGYVAGDPDFTPCSAYDCVRQCCQKYYPNNINTNNVSDFKTTYDCIVACPGTSYPSFDSLFGGSGGPSGGGGSSGGPGESSIGVDGNTSLRAAGGFSQINSSPTSSGLVIASATDSASNIQASSTSPSSRSSTVSSTGSASTPSPSKSAGSLVLSPELAVLAAGFTFLFSMLRP